MGGFFLSKGFEERSLERVRRVFAARGFGRPEIETWGDVVLWRFGKLAGTWVPRVSMANGDCLYLSGSLRYRGLGGVGGAERLLSDIQADAVDHDEMIGAFFAVIHQASNGSLRFITDRFGMYHFFSDYERTFLTSSFLAAAVVDPSSVRVDAGAVLENLCLGFVMPPRTLLEKIERVGPADRWKVCRTFGRFIEPAAAPGGNVKCRSFRKCVSNQIAVLREAVLGIVGPVSETDIAMGLSGGYDSRLLLLLAREAGVTPIAHTHFKVDPDPDPVIARRVADAVGVPLVMPRTPRPEEMGERELAGTVMRSLLFFDGRVHSQMGLFRQEYTPEYRHQVYSGAQTVLSGVGGEIYRNHDGSGLGGVGRAAWLAYHVIGYPTMAALEGDEVRQRVLDQLGEKIAHRLGIEEKGALSLMDRRRFYEEIWLADWHGLRNSVESQYAGYFSPFAHPPVMRAARSALPFLGANGAFEAAMIHQLDPEIARISSSYGHGFDRIPFSRRLRSGIWARVPAGSKLRVGMFRVQGHAQSVDPLHSWESRFSFVGMAMDTLRAMGLPIDFNRFATNRTRLVLLLSVAVTVAALQAGPDPSRWQEKGSTK